MNSHRTDVWSQVAYDRTNNRKQRGVTPASLSYSAKDHEKFKDFCRANSWINRGQEFNAYAASRLREARAEFKKSDTNVKKRSMKHVRWAGRRERTNVGVLVIGKFM
jgi:hypothetical protein